MRLSPRVLATPLAVAAVVAAVLVTGDLGGQDATDPGAAAPSTTSTGSTVSDEEFCAGFEALATARQLLLDAPSPAAVRALQDAARSTGELAAGTEMPPAAKDGVDYVVAAFLGLDEDATAEDLVESDEAATLRDDANADALLAHLSDSCTGPPPDEPR